MAFELLLLCLVLSCEDNEESFLLVKKIMFSNEDFGKWKYKEGLASKQGRHRFKMGRNSNIYFRTSCIIIASAPQEGRRAKGEKLVFKSTEVESNLFI